MGLCPDRRLLSLDTSAILDCVTPRSLVRARPDCRRRSGDLLLSACGSPQRDRDSIVEHVPVQAPDRRAHPFTRDAHSPPSSPPGWTDETTSQSAVASVSGSGTVVMLLRGGGRGHIDARTAPQPIADDQLAQYLESVSQSGATNLSTAEPIDLDGVSGVMITYNLAAAGVTVQGRGHGGQPGRRHLRHRAQHMPWPTSPATRQRLQTVLNDWKWT